MTNASTRRCCRRPCAAPCPHPTPNLRHLEWFHDYVRIESLFFDGALDPTGRPDATAPGLGLVLRRADAERYRGG